MSRVIATAPGKVVLSGEYAVLDGAAAVCMAVNRRARVTATPNGGASNSVVAPGFATTEGRFEASRDHFEWLQGGDSYALFEQVWRSADVRPAGSTSWSLDTSEFLDARSNVKLGLGSSAAMAVALAAALCEQVSANVDVAQVACVAHRAFQQGVGSGIDIACSLHGGIIEFRTDGERAIGIKWPDGLEFALLWSGVPSATRGKLEQLQRNGKQRSHTSLVAAADAMAIAWRSGNAETVLGGYREYINVLRDFNVDHDLGIFDAGHGALVDTANDMGLIYKPCGAGGGDIGIALARDAAAIDAFVASPVASGFERLPVQIDPVGVQVSREQQ